MSDTAENNESAVREVMGMFILAFGRGVPKGINVKREVITAIYGVLEKGVKGTIGRKGGGWDTQWQRESNTVLSLMEAVGALSAHLAMQNNDTVVKAANFTQAFESVRATRQGPAAGDWCA
jgi:hypothetical protein